MTGVDTQVDPQRHALEFARHLIRRDWEILDAVVAGRLDRNPAGQVKIRTPAVVPGAPRPEGPAGLRLAKVVARARVADLVELKLIAPLPEGAGTYRLTELGERVYAQKAQAAAAAPCPGSSPTRIVD